MVEIHGSPLPRLKRGLGAQGFSQVVQVLIRLAEVPLLLSFWGARLYGEWLMVTSIAAYLSMSEGGFASAAGREMAMRSGAKDHGGALAVFQSTWVLLLLVSGSLLLVAMPIIHALPLSAWLHFEEISSASVKIILLLMVAYVLVGIQGGLIYGGFWCTGRYPLGMALASVMQLLEFVGLAAAVLLGGGPVEAAAGFLGGRGLGTIVMWRGLLRTTPWLRYGFERASSKEMVRLASPAVASLAFPFGNALNIQGMWLVVGLVLGPAAVTVFAPIRTMTRFAIQPTAVINRVIEPEMGTAFGNGDDALFSRLFTRSCQATVWLSLAACLALAVTGSWLLPLWTGGKVEMHWPLFLLLLATAAINATWNTALMVPYATNRHGRVAVVYSIIYGGGAFVLAYVWGKLFGFTGIGAALVFVEVLMGLYVFTSALRLSGQHWLGWLRILIRPPMFLFRHGLLKL